MLTPNKNYDFLRREFINRKETGIDTFVMEGASRSGKTWDTCCFMTQIVRNFSGLQIVIARDYRSTLKKTLYKTLKKVWSLDGLPHHHFNKVASDIHFNGNVISFIGTNDNLDSVMGLEADILWCNEAIDVNKQSLDQLEQRTTGLKIYDYNPKYATHSIYEKARLPNVAFLQTTIFDNPNAPKRARQKILSYAHPDVDDLHVAKMAKMTASEWKAFKDQNLKSGTADSYLWRVYGLGLRSSGDAIIFSPHTYKVVDFDTSAVNKNADWTLYGIDFGYKNDPSAIVKVWKRGNNLYVKEELCETGMLNRDIANFLKDKTYDSLVVCDSASPQNIAELRALDIPAVAAQKGTGSVAWGIQALQSLNLIIHQNSANLIKELKGYLWDKDRSGNYKRNSLGQRVPVQNVNDDSIDATRYAATYYMDFNLQD